jgi:translocation protein SEC72
MYSPATPQQHPPSAGPLSAIDPAIQAAIDANFRSVNLKLGPPDNSTVLCLSHSREKCADCNLDFSITNRLAKLLILNPNLMCPPPSNVVSQKLTQAVNSMKEEGNVRSILFIIDSLL